MSESVGARLRQARELRRLTLQQVSESTKLRSHYLQALEADDYSAIPSAAQARGFLHIYASFLELDLSQVIPPSAQAEAAAAASGEPQPASQETRRPSLWAGLRQRLGRRKPEEVTSAPAILPAEEPPPTATMDASSIYTASTRPAGASDDAKKNALS